MKYVLINKLTNNIVEKIIFPDGGFKPKQEMFPSYLELIIVEDDVIIDYTMRYDEKSQSFVLVTESDKDNPKVSKELLDIKLALAEIVEGGLL